MEKLVIRSPDDWHCHLRDGDFLQRTVVDQATQFSRSLIMPNLQPPVETLVEARAYRQFILEHLPDSLEFDPLMTLYLTPRSDPLQLMKAAQSASVKAVKLYPKGATTHSDFGVNNLEAMYPCLDVMQQHGLILCVHGEVTDRAVDIFDREKVFLEQSLEPIRRQFPALKIVLEHITTADSVEFVQCYRDNTAATITPHHLLINRNDLLVGGIKPHYYCLPVVKRRRHQEALIQAATSGESCFFLGTDSAPHVRSKKESSCGCAGIYSAHAAIELYAEAFEKAGKLPFLEDFASRFGAEFYGLPLNTNTITLRRQAWTVPEVLSFGDEVLVPFFAGKTLQWKLDHEAK